MTTSTQEATAALEAANAVHDAELSVQQTQRLVDELAQVATSALGVLDDAQLDSARAMMTDRRDYYAESASDHMRRLQGRCTDLAELGQELSQRLGRAVDAVRTAAGLVEDVQADPEHAATAASLGPRLAILAETLDLAQPMAAAATRHVDAAHQASLNVTAGGLLQPPLLGSLEANVRAASYELDRADEDLRLLGTVVDRASSSANHAAGEAAEISDTARRRLATGQQAGHHDLGATGGLGIPDPNRSGPTR